MEDIPHGLQDYSGEAIKTHKVHGVLDVHGATCTLAIIFEYFKIQFKKVSKHKV